MAYWDYPYFKPSTPRTARGGIKAQSQGRNFGKSWWARRWIEVLESFNLGARLTRGRSYARRGQVLSIDIEKGAVIAKVQGSRSQPYQVSIKIHTLSRKQWEMLAKVLSQQALFVAKLLAGEMPENIEDAFREAGLSLFPKKSRDLQTDCSCPDWSNPCKHIAAVYYLLGEEFDRDPFLIFKLRGTDQLELAKLIGSEQPASQAKTDPEQESTPAPEPLPVDPEAFWGHANMPDDLLNEVRVPTLAAALPQRLGNFPFWRGEEHFLSALTEIYRLASPLGMDIFLGEYRVIIPKKDE